jgi:hypothetical protein
LFNNFRLAPEHEHGTANYSIRKAIHTHFSTNNGKPGDILDESEPPGEEKGDGCGIPLACYRGQAQKDLALEHNS